MMRTITAEELESAVEALEPNQTLWSPVFREGLTLARMDRIRNLASEVEVRPMGQLMRWVRVVRAGAGAEKEQG